MILPQHENVSPITGLPQHGNVPSVPGLPRRWNIPFVPGLPGLPDEVQPVLLVSPVGVSAKAARLPPFYERKRLQFFSDDFFPFPAVAITKRHS